MKNLSKIFLLFVALGVTIATTSCNKEEEPTNTELLTKTWRITEVYINSQLASDTGFNSFRLTFSTAGTYSLTYTGGAENGVWEFNADETQIIIDKGTADEFIWEILSLTIDASRLRTTDDDGDVLEYVFVPV
jgi:hypothetical protein